MDSHGSYFTWYSVDKGMVFSAYFIDKGGFVILPAAHPYQKFSKHRPGPIRINLIHRTQISYGKKIGDIRTPPQSVRQ